MPVIGKVALVVLAGGVALGAMLGAAANPVMKAAPEQPWRSAFQAPVAAGASYIMVEAGPEDLSPYQESYAPTWAREELASWEPEYPEWTYSDLVDERYENLSVTEEPRVDEQPVTAEAEATTTLEPAPIQPAIAEAAPEPHEPPAPSALAGIY